jgi:hypothetical protein
MSTQQFKMIASKFKDSDGFVLQFEENCPEADKKFYIKEFPTVDLIASKKPHCTTCGVHIGTSPIAEKVIRTHAILGVTQCVKCYTFYVSQSHWNVPILSCLLNLQILYFRILVNLEKGKMEVNITVGGADKEEK